MQTLHTENDHQFQDFIGVLLGMRFCCFAFLLIRHHIFTLKTIYLFCDHENQPNQTFWSHHLCYSLFSVHSASVWFDSQVPQLPNHIFFLFVRCIFITNANGFACDSQIQNEFISSSRFISSIKVYWSLRNFLMTGRLILICMCAFVFKILCFYFCYENGIASIEFTHNILFSSGIVCMVNGKIRPIANRKLKNCAYTYCNCSLR